MESAKTIVACVAVVIVMMGYQVAGEYDVSGSDAVEGPRVERMHPESSSGCTGSNCLIENSEGSLGAMWFGPRLGRKRRSEFQQYSPKKIEALSEMLASPTWGYVNSPAVNGQSTWSAGADDKRQDINFTPRLGRELDDAFSTYDLVQHLLNRIEDRSDRTGDQQPPPMFPPRLGRTLGTPKLERELRNLLRKLQTM